MPVDELVVAGGLLKNALLMQIYADVLGSRSRVIGVRPGPGARLGHPRRRRRRRLPRRAAPRRRRWAGARPRRLPPDPGHRGAYDALYAEYGALHDYFGRGGNDAMHRLRAISAAPSPAVPRMSGSTPRTGAPTPRRPTVAELRRRSPTCTPSCPLRAGRLDRRQRVRPGCRGATSWSSSRQGSPTTTSRPRSMVVTDLHGELVDGEPLPRPTPRPTPTSIGTCPRSAGSCTPIRRTPRPGRPGSSRSRVC